jgi:hypothetical protein
VEDVGTTDGMVFALGLVIVTRLLALLGLREGSGGRFRMDGEVEVA